MTLHRSPEEEFDHLMDHGFNYAQARERSGFSGEVEPAQLTIEGIAAAEEQINIASQSANGSLARRSQSSRALNRHEAAVKDLASGDHERPDKYPQLN